MATKKSIPKSSTIDITYCDHCKSSYEKTTYNQRYCSYTCNKTAKRKRHSKRALKQRDGVCTQCNQPFSIVAWHDPIYCSKECRGKGVGDKHRKFLDIPACIEGADRKLDKTLGYVRVYVPMHPEANTWGYVYEHRIVAEQTIGRRLKKGEIVHHKNGKRWDNRPENLEVMTASDHGKLHGQRPEDLNDE